MYLETPKKFRSLANQVHRIADSYFRPISRKHGKTEYAYPKELDLFAALLDGTDSDSPEAVGAAPVSKRASKWVEEGIKDGGNLLTSLGVTKLCRGDVGLLLAMPCRGLGDATIVAVANEEQLQRFGGTWVAMAITEPGCGLDSAAIRTTTIRGGDHYVSNGEKIFVTSGERADVVVVWTILDRNLGQATIESFVVEKGTPGITVTYLEKKLKIKASDTAPISFNNCRVPATNLLSNAKVNVQRDFVGVMETFGNTRPLVVGMAVRVAKVAPDRIRELLGKASYKFDCRRPLLTTSHAEATLYRLEAEWEATRLLALKATQMTDNKLPNSKEASITKAKAGRVVSEVTLKCVELVSAFDYTEDELLEKWTRDSKILDIFESTRQVQLLIAARRLLSKSSSQLKQKRR